MWHGVCCNREGLRFFVPGRLVRFEYLGGDGTTHDAEAEQYTQVADFAFFAVNFGYSKADYLSLTPREAMFIRKEYENHLVSHFELMSKAVANGVSNALRKRGKRAHDLFKKKPKVGNKLTAKAMRAVVDEVEQRDGKDWVKRIYSQTGFKPRKGVK